MFEIDRQKFGAFVSQLRKEKGYTQKELAQHLFISDKAISKWETGVSIPDTALLIPLADLLGVTVTELLMCERIQHSNPIKADQVESIVKTAITYAEDNKTRAYHLRSKWTLVYVFSLLVGCISLFLGSMYGEVSETLATLFMLCTIFGAYFCFFIKIKLSTYYDENPIGTFNDGPIRINLSGLRFNNSNWPYIINVGRIWSCLSLAAFPTISLFMKQLLPAIWVNIEGPALLVLILGGLFVPLYIMGKKSEK